MQSVGCDVSEVPKASERRLPGLTHAQGMHAFHGNETTQESQFPFFYNKMIMCDFWFAIHMIPNYI